MTKNSEEIYDVINFLTYTWFKLHFYTFYSPLEVTWYRYVMERDATVAIL